MRRNSLKKIGLASACAVGFLLPSCLYAQIIMTEVMYDVEGTDTGREWIEVQNNSQQAIDLSAWKLFEANTAHKLTAIGTSILPAGAFAILADVPDKFNADHPGFQGLIFDTTFSLSNVGETLSLRDASGVDADSVSYLPEWGAGGDTFSLQKSSDNKWIAARPTPGSVTTATQSEISPDTAITSSGTSGNATSTSNTSTISSESITYSAYSSQSVANTSPDTSDMEVTSGRARLGFVGMPLEFRARVRKNNDSLLDIEHVWSMGDGALKYGTPVSYIYRFAGNYTVILNSHTKETVAVSRTKVKIINPALSILTANTDYIEIFNADEYEVNLGGMVLRTKGNRTVLGEDTIVGPHSSIRLPSSSTKLGTVKDFVALDSSLGNNFTVLPLVDRPVVLPEGMSLEDMRVRIINALKTYGK